MIRIPNPGVDPENFLRVFKALDEILGEAAEFDLDGITSAIVEKRLMSSQGAQGAEAVKRSTRPDRSRDGMYNNSKMYAETLRSLGWLGTTRARLRFQITPLGRFVAKSTVPNRLFKECLLGWAYPNEVLEVKSTQSLRPFHAILRTMNSAGGVLSRDEMILGPMSLENDRDAVKFGEMVQYLVRLRAGLDSVGADLEALGAELRVAVNTLQNYTRFPMSLIVGVGWARKDGARRVLTGAGRSDLSRVEMLRDFRLGDYNSAAADLRPALIRVSFHEMLNRCGEQDGLDPAQLEKDRLLLEVRGFPKDVPLWFSPFQQVAIDEIRVAMPNLWTVSASAGTSVLRPVQALVRRALNDPGFSKPRELPSQTVVPYESTAQGEQQARPESDLRTQVERDIAAASGDLPEAVGIFAERHSTDNKDVFYPLVRELFQACGIECSLSRSGDNYSRFDASLVLETALIPIEIKSPGEEMDISVKAVRQALENKVVLLARPPTPLLCLKDDVTLVVGFNLPSRRSDVNELVEDVYRAYGVRIGLVSFSELVRMAFDSFTGAVSIDVPRLRQARGVIHFERG